ncbi:MAG TPA: hypothetical protein VMX96_04260 [Dehalococcoidia bacterium]|nr:hypothetical protein [Dehalococcoidia bacterium]
MTWNIPHRIILGLCLSFLLLCFASPVSAQSIPLLPHAFYGNVTIGGEPAPVGTLVSAKVHDIDSGSVTTWDLGSYGWGVGLPPEEAKANLLVQGEDISDGDTIDFYINYERADQDFTFESGEVTQLDLSVDWAPPVTPTPMPTGTPAVTPTATPAGTPSSTPTPTPIVGTSVAIECCSDVPESGSCDVDITIATDDPEGIGSATITLTVNTAVVSVGNVADGDLGFVAYNTVGDTTTMTAATGASPGPTGTITFGTVTLNAVGSSGDCSDLDITVIALNDGTAGDPQPIIPDEVTDCTFCIGTSATPTATTTPTPTPDGGGLSGGAIAGIVVGSLIAGALVMLLIMRRGG